MYGLFLTKKVFTKDSKLALTFDPDIIPHIIKMVTFSF